MIKESNKEGKNFINLEDFKLIYYEYKKNLMSS